MLAESNEGSEPGDHAATASLRAGILGRSWAWFRSETATAQAVKAGVAILAVFVVIAALKGGAATESQPQTSQTQGRTPEQDMAIVDNSATAAQYAAILTQLEGKCPESRREIADITARARTAVKQTRGVSVSLSRMASAIESAVPVGKRLSCLDVATAVGLTIGR